MAGAFNKPILRVWFAGACIVLVTVAGASLLTQADFFIIAIFYAVLCGLVLLFLCMSLSDDDAFFIAGFCGLVIGVGASLAGQDEVALFGSSARDVVAANVPASGAAFLHFRNARVLADRAVSVEVQGKSGQQRPHLLYYLQVAPIVDAGWTEGQPVAALAVIGSPQLGHRTSEWRAPLNGGAALNGQHSDERAKAVLDLVRFQNLKITPDAVFLRWSSDPEGEAATARRRIWAAYLIALGLWSVSVLVNGIILRVRTTRRGDDIDNEHHRLGKRR